MKVTIGMSGNLSKEELRSLMQAIETWGEQQGDKVVGFEAPMVDVPGLTREEINELLRGIYPFVREVYLPLALSVRPPGGKLLSFGPRTIVIGDRILGTCGDLTITIDEATDEDIECFENAPEIRLVKIMKG